MNCQRCGAPDRPLSGCPDCGRKVCAACKPGEVCRSCAGPFSKVDTKPAAHDDAVARLKAIGVYEQCVATFGWAR